MDNALFSFGVLFMRFLCLGFGRTTGQLKIFGFVCLKFGRVCARNVENFVFEWFLSALT